MKRKQSDYEIKHGEGKTFMDDLNKRLCEEHAIEFEDWIDKNAFIKGFGDNRNNWYKINGDFVGTTKNLYQLFREQLNNLP